MGRERPDTPNHHGTGCVWASKEEEEEGNGQTDGGRGGNGVERNTRHHPFFFAPSQDEQQRQSASHNRGTWMGREGKAVPGDNETKLPSSSSFIRRLDGHFPSLPDFIAPTTVIHP